LRHRDEEVWRLDRDDLVIFAVKGIEKALPD
jgi:hypothetical protein